MKTVKLFIEGGGDSKYLHTECRRAFSSFLQKAGLCGYMPRIVACGSRNDAYDSYCTAVNNGEEAVLLVDSEASVIMPSEIAEDSDPKSWKPWHHLKNRLGQMGQAADNWNKPVNASDEDCHLMVELMEAWFFADIDALKQYYGQGFNEHSLSRRACIESISKAEVIRSLENATRATKKGTYSKGNHSFEILAQIDPDKVTSQSKWAKRFVTLLLEKMQGR